jgi:hypothetical protein
MASELNAPMCNSYLVTSSAQAPLRDSAWNALAARIAQAVAAKMHLRRFAPVIALAGLATVATAIDAYASAAAVQVVVDSAPRMPLPSEPPVEPLLLAHTPILASGAAVVAAVLMLAKFVRRRARSAPRPAEQPTAPYFEPIPSHPRHRIAPAGARGAVSRG